MFIILLILIKQKLQIQQLSKILVLEDIFRRNGLKIVAIEILTGKYKLLYDQRKLTIQQVTAKQRVSHRSVIVSCILRQVQIIMARMFIAASSEQILLKLVTLVFIIIVFHQEVPKRWAALEFRFF